MSCSRGPGDGGNRPHRRHADPLVGRAQTAGRGPAREVPGHLAGDHLGRVRGPCRARRARAVTAAFDPGARVLIAEGQEQVDEALAARAGLPGLEWIVYIEPRGVRDYAEPSLVWWPDLLAHGGEHRAEHPRLLDELAAEVGDDDLVTSSLTASQVNRILATPPHPDPGPGDFVVCHQPLSQMASRRSSAWLNADAGVQLHFGEPSSGLPQTL